MRKILFCGLLLLLTACAGTEPERPIVSRSELPAIQGMTYQQFRNLSIHGDDDLRVVQKRFVMLDHDNNGILTQNEFSGY